MFASSRLLRNAPSGPLSTTDTAKGEMGPNLIGRRAPRQEVPKAAKSEPDQASLLSSLYHQQQIKESFRLMALDTRSRWRIALRNGHKYLYAKSTSNDPCEAYVTEDRLHISQLDVIGTVIPV